MPVSGSPTAVVSRPAAASVCTTDCEAAATASVVTVLAMLAEPALVAAKKVAGSWPLSCATTSSVTGVMLAVALAPLPLASECSVVLPLLASSTQGSTPSVMDSV